MSTRTGRRAAVAAVLLSLAAVAADAAAGRPPVEKLLRDLGDRDYRVREAATRALRERGEEALPALRRACEAADPEIRRRLALLTQSIERSVLLSPKLVTLKANRRPAAEVVKELARQTGYPVSVQEGDAKAKVPLTLNLERVPFWLALDKICLDAGLSFTQNGEAESLVLTASDTVSPYVTYSGPFRVSAVSFHANRSLNLGAVPKNAPEPATEGLNFFFALHVEPKLPILSVGGPRVLLAADDQGQAMAYPEEPGGNYEANYPSDRGTRMFSQQSSLVLGPPGRDARKVRVLKAGVPVVVLSEQRPELVIDNVQKLRGKRATSASIDIEVSRTDEGPNKTFNVHGSFRNVSKAANQHDYSWANSMHQRLELADAQGNKFASLGPSNVNYHSPTHFDATYSFSLQPPGGAKYGPPAKLVYNQWVTATHQVEFEFKDLPLP